MSINVQRSSTNTLERPGAHSGSEIRLQGAWLVLAGIAWMVLALMAIGLFVVALPSYFAYLHVTNTASFYALQQMRKPYPRAEPALDAHSRSQSLTSSL